MVAPKKIQRPGRTEKISVSIARDDLVFLQARAKRLYQSNISAVIAEGVQRVRQEEGRQALLDWLGDAASSSAEDAESLRAELRGEEPARAKSARSTRSRSK